MTPVQRADLRIHLREFEDAFLAYIQQRRSEIVSQQAQFPELTEVLKREATILDNYEREVMRRRRNE